MPEISFNGVSTINTNSVVYNLAYLSLSFTLAMNKDDCDRNHYNLPECISPVSKLNRLSLKVSTVCCLIRLPLVTAVCKSQSQ